MPTTEWNRKSTDSLTRVVDGESIVDSVSLRVRTSDVVAVIGPSGAGKSAFLRHLNRLDEPADGTVFLDGTDYREIDPQNLRRRIGPIPQDAALSRGTVAGNVALGARVRDSIKSPGIVQIPGLMAGMIIAGANPIYAAQYQFVIMLMIFAAGGLTVVVNTILISRRVFTGAKRLDDGVLDAIET
nr:ABC transporter permease [Natronococcus sp. CG52]